MVILKQLDPNYKGEAECEGGTCSVLLEKEEVQEDAQTTE